MRLLITGANGFIGQALTNRMLTQGKKVRLAIRKSCVADNKYLNLDTVKIDESFVDFDWGDALRNVEVVVHLAGRVHVMNEKSPDSLSEFRRVNVKGTANLARQAASSGVRRFIFLSSIKVNGEITKLGSPFLSDDLPNPQDPYALSKFEAEQILGEIAKETGMEVVIIRSPLVYGVGVKANFQKIISWVIQGIPLPLASATFNRRSFVNLDNLVDLIATCLAHPAAANQIFLVSDGEDLSTADLCKRISYALDRPIRLLHISPSVLKTISTVFGKFDVYQRLFCSLQVDISKTCRLLDWSPPQSVDDGLKSMARGIRK